MTVDTERMPSLLYAIKQVELAVRNHLDEVLRPVGITVTQYTALTVLSRRNGVTSAALARNAFVTPQSMADLVTALDRRGLIARTPDPAHGRRILLRLTSAGHALLADVATAVRAVEDHMLRELDETERAQLRDYLNRCRTALGA